MRRNTDEKFWARVDQSAGPDSCWPWTGRRKPSGHGCYDHDGTWSYAHRYAYVLIKGQPEHFILHDCDNGWCCNPAHLYDGTQAQNVRDRDQRGRRDVRGERHPRAKLTDAQVEEIIDLYSTGRFTQKQLGAQYGVDHTTISYATTGRRKRSNAGTGGDAG